MALLLLLLPDPYRLGMAATVRGTVLRPVFALQRGAADREGRFADASLVRAERDSLAAFLVGQADLAAENRELRGLLGMRPRLPYTFVPAEVVRLTGPAAQGTFLLTAGRAQGVRPGAPIVTAQGLVGTVRTVDERSAVGIDWTHSDFRASAVALDGETYGIVEPRVGATGDASLALTSTALHTVPKQGTGIVTSGAGGYYPRGIPIGTVAGTERDAGSWQKVYRIRPLVSPAEMAHVLVLGERKEQATDQDLAAAWGIRLKDATPPDSLALPVAPSAPRPAAQTQT
ncbi:MAG: rod shape-determining protein MreC, partial [Gemmatimonadota bacterium]|nr:rod shape-determining protein MreC [Gemmatimonadota bacterium]